MQLASKFSTASMIKKALLLVTAIVIVLSACSSISAHQNFIQQMDAKVGKVFDSNKMTWGGQKYLMQVKTLPNGNLERAYKFRRTCLYFFEIDSATDVVLRWRYEGNEDDCAVPN